jgi:hypothetical protein
MLIIQYKQNDSIETIEFMDGKAFIGAQLMEVPKLQDHYPIVKLTENDQEIEFTGTNGDLFNMWMQ